jgi:hypothetical protein
LFFVITIRSFPKEEQTIQRANQNPYIEEEQTTQWPKVKSAKGKNNDLQNTTQKTKD